jgi:ribokinase
MLRGALEAEGIDVSGVAVRAGTASGVGVVTVAEDGENAIVVAPGANATLRPEDVEKQREAIGAADVLVVQLEVPIETVSRAAQIAREMGTTVLLNAAPARDLPVALLANVDVLVVNESEAARLSGQEAAGDEGVGPAGLFERLGPLGVPCAVMTAGAGGAWFGRAGEPSAHVRAFEIRAVDCVGAGDAFVGVLAVRWAEHQAGGGVDAMALLDAVTWASAAGAIAATREGAIPSMPRRSEIVAMLKSC